MIFNKKLAVAVSGAVLLMAGQFALADSTTDIVDALVSKGVLTEEEGKLISKGAKSQKEAQDKSIKGKLSISGALENANLYGDIRVRGETRTADGFVGTTLGHDNLSRARYKYTFGVETKAGDFYTDLALSGGSGGRSDNIDTGTSTTANAAKATIYLNRAMVGWKATDWLTLEAGRMKNPLYTTPMVWDADLPIEGLTEKFNFKAGSVDIFATASQMAYKATYEYQVNATSATSDYSQELLAFQAGFKTPITETSSAKAAITYYDYTHAHSKKQAQGIDGVYVPGLNNTSYGTTRGTFGASSSGTNYVNPYGVNDLSIIEIPAEVNFLASSNIGIRFYGDYARNLDADKRAAAAAAFSAQTVADSDGEDTAWLLGVVVGSAADLKSFEGNKLKKGDWQARLWYQETGVWALDPNLVDSDFFESRVNVNGTIFKGQYNWADNFYTNVAYGHGKRNDARFATAGVGDFKNVNYDSMDLFQLDFTYKF